MVFAFGGRTGTSLARDCFRPPFLFKTHQATSDTITAYIFLLLAAGTQFLDGITHAGRLIFLDVTTPFEVPRKSSRKTR